MSYTHIMLSSMGKYPKKTKYILNGEVRVSGYASLATWGFMPDDNKPEKISLLLTAEAEMSAFPSYKDEADKLGVVVEPIRMTSDEAVEPSCFLKKCSDHIPRGCRLTLDITQGLRHQSFLFFGLAMYLKNLKNVTLEGIYYCCVDYGSENEPKKIIDLKPVLDMTMWFHALGVFKETGSTRLVSEYALERITSMLKDTRTDKDILNSARECAENLGRLSKAWFPCYLPEIGHETRNILQKKSEFNTALKSYLPMAEEIVENLCNDLEKISLPEEYVIDGNWKNKLLLNRTELERQSRIIDSFLDKGLLSTAFIAIQEWVISYLMFQDGVKNNWMSYDERRRYPVQLNCLSRFIKTNTRPEGISLSDEENKWGRFWKTLTQFRNPSAHAGIQGKPVKISNEKIIIDFWNRLKNFEIEFPFRHASGGKLLISSIGNSPGVLFSALKHVNPDKCLVICSEQSHNSISQACEKAKWSGELQVRKLDDPYQGYGEFKRIISESAKLLYEADEIHANLTGGTSLMGVLVGRLIKKAKNYCQSIEEFVLIDKRSSQEQREDPWQLGEIYPFKPISSANTTDTET